MLNISYLFLILFLLTPMVLEQCDCQIARNIMRARYKLRRPSRIGFRRHRPRTRFMTRMNRLGPMKTELLRSGALRGPKKSLPPGFAFISGEVMDVSNKIVQRMVPGGTAYFAYQDILGKHPLYKRPGNEVGWHFILFQDPYYWRGSGHLVMLKKVLGVNINRLPGENRVLYEAYILSLRISMHPNLWGSDRFFIRRKVKEARKVAEFMVRTGGYARRSRPLRRLPLRDRSGRIGGRRRKRDIHAHPKKKHFQGDCLLKRLNVTKLYLRVKKASINVKHLISDRLVKVE